MTELQWTVGKNSLKKALALLMTACIFAMTIVMDVGAAGPGKETEKGNEQKQEQAKGQENAQSPEDGKTPGEGKPITVREIELNKKELNLTEGSTGILIATIIPGYATYQKVRWESDGRVARVKELDDKTAIGTALSHGTTTIRATINGKEASCTVNVVKAREIAAKSISLSRTSLELKAGGKENLTVRMEPSNATIQNVEWKSSDPAVVAVEDSKRSTIAITAMTKGEATITATVGTMAVSCKVTVGEAVAVQSIRFDKTSLALQTGDKDTLTAAIAPSDAAIQEVEWKSSAPAVAAIQDSGAKMATIQAMGKGEAVITAAAGGKTATCKVKVTSTASITLKTKSASIQAGKTVTIGIAAKNPQQDLVTFTSSDKSIATVSDGGVVKGIKEGSVTITVKTESGAQAAFRVKVVKAATAVLVKRSQTLEVGKTTKIQIDAAASTSSSIKACSSSAPKVASVDNKGVVTAKKSGRATITVTMQDGAKAQFSVTVKKKAPTASVKLVKSKGKVKVGKKMTIKIGKTVPAKDKIKKCVSNKTKVATVNNKGVVTGKKPGKAVITVTMKSGATAKFTVTVKKK